MTIETRLAEIRARVEAATPGPWRASVVATYVDADGQRSGKGGVYPGGEQGSPPLFLTMGWLATDAEFIAASRTDLPALLAAIVDALNVENERMPSGSEGDDWYRVGWQDAMFNVKSRITDALEVQG